MKIYSSAIICLALAAGACTSETPTNQNQAPNTAAVQPAPAAKEPSISPTETVQALNKAAKEKNAEAIKKLVSKGTLSIVEQSAAEEKQDVNTLLSEDPPLPELAETRNEQIQGDTASVEVRQNEKSGWERLPLVKEDGEWKVAFDVYLKEFEEQLTQDMKEPPPAGENAEKPKK